MDPKTAPRVDGEHQDEPTSTRSRWEVLGQVPQGQVDPVGTGTGPGGANVCGTGWTQGHMGTSSPLSSSRMDSQLP